VAVLNDEFVGLCGAHLPVPGEPVELVSMWTAPAARGHGVGRSLVEAVLEWVTKHDPPAVELWVTRGNEPAVRLYQACGFDLTDETTPSPADPCREELRMCRSLGTMG
jgi:GNAT superfamily N-acetyltransferase